MTSGASSASEQAPPAPLELPTVGAQRPRIWSEMAVTRVKPRGRKGSAVTVRLATATVVAVVLAVPSSAQRSARPPAGQALQEPARAPDDGRGTPYVVDKSDNICGIDEPRAITNPAKVDYRALLAATPEVRRIKKRKIDRGSAQGTHLMAQARRRVLAACETVSEAEGHSSVWKKIARRDRRPIEDVTAKVKAAINRV